MGPVGDFLDTKRNADWVGVFLSPFCPQKFPCQVFGWDGNEKSICVDIFVYVDVPYKNNIYIRSYIILLYIVHNMIYARIYTCIYTYKV